MFGNTKERHWKKEKQGNTKIRKNRKKYGRETRKTTDRQTDETMIENEKIMIL